MKAELIASLLQHKFLLAALLLHFCAFLALLIMVAIVRLRPWREKQKMSELRDEMVEVLDILLKQLEAEHPLPDAIQRKLSDLHYFYWVDCVYPYRIPLALLWSFPWLRLVLPGNLKARGTFSYGQSRPDINSAEWLELNARKYAARDSV
jgi:hypothetical protein